MVDATPLTPLVHERHSILKCKQHTLHDPWGPEKYDYTMMNPGRHFTAAIPVMFFHPLVEFYFKLFISACVG